MKNNAIGTDHLKNKRFRPFECDGVWSTDNQDYYERQIKSPKIIGLLLEEWNYSLKIIIDTRHLPQIPFGYMWTFIDQYSEETRNKIYNELIKIRQQEHTDEQN